MSGVIIQNISAEYLPVPLTDPFVLSIRSATNANLVRWRFMCSNGKTYLGESVPVQYVTGETVESVLAVVNAINELLDGHEILDPTKMLQEVEELLKLQPAARAGVEIGITNAYADIFHTNVWNMFGGAEAELETDVTLSKVADVVRIAARYYSEGFRIFKMKVGGEKIDNDLDHLRELHRRFPDARIRVDANQGFDQESALAFIDTLERDGIRLELMEQPVPKEEIAQLDFVASRSAVPIIADEACRTVEDAQMLFSQTAVHGVNIKVMKCGLYGADAIAHLAKRAKRQLMIGCMLESAVGIAAGAALAAGMGGFDYIDLDGHFLLAEKFDSKEFAAEGPMIRMLS